MLSNDDLEKLMGRIFDGAREGFRQTVEPNEYARRRQDFIFHMTDWKSELSQLEELFKDPNRQGQSASSDLVIGFIYHVVPHLNAAGRLLLDEVLDPFSKPQDNK